MNSLTGDNSNLVIVGAFVKTEPGPSIALCDFRANTHREHCHNRQCRHMVSSRKQTKTRKNSNSIALIILIGTLN